MSYTLAALARTEEFREALANQKLKDAILVVDPQLEHLSKVDRLCSFCLISCNDFAMKEALTLPGILIYWTVQMESERTTALVIEDTQGHKIGVLVDLRLLGEHGKFIKRCSNYLVEDVILHVSDLGFRVAAIVGVDIATRTFIMSEESKGWRLGATPGDAKFDIPDMVTCGTNEFYGHGSILRKYCGVDSSLPIVGRMQHGWAPYSYAVYEGDAFVGPNLRTQKVAPLYSWTKRTATPEVIVVGAQYLYLPKVEDPGPASNKILAVPSHSISKVKMKGLIEYIEEVKRFAKGKYDSVTVLLYHADMNLAEEVKSLGVDVASCGVPADTTYLLKMRNILLQHAAVTADRVCTAVFYGLYESRKFHLVGNGYLSSPDTCEDVVTDLSWIRETFPSLLDGSAGRMLAEQELGLEYKRQPGELRRLLYSWIYE